MVPVIRAPFEERNCVHCHGLHLRLFPRFASFPRITFHHASSDTFDKLFLTSSRDT